MTPASVPLGTSRWTGSSIRTPSASGQRRCANEGRTPRSGSRRSRSRERPLPTTGRSSRRTAARSASSRRPPPVRAWGRSASRCSMRTSRRTARRSRSRWGTAWLRRRSRRSRSWIRRNGGRATERARVAPVVAEQLFGVVPNFSDGRRADVIEAICRALEVPGAHLVYRQADPDHNRLDTTVLGTPDAVRRSALAGAAKAIELIDMERHTGSHPRMGAADVIPFVPLRGITMDETVELARGVARELADTLRLPVYLYDRAALVPERHSLAEIRKGEYEALKEAVARGDRLPDFGPHAIGRAGATAVGARKHLIAFNVYLSGTDEAGAKEIARAVRDSSGGLPAVRAIGFLVPERGCVTVSMNLVDHEVTGLRSAFEAVRVEADKRGMATLSSEIVGLVPQAAITDQDVIDLRLEEFDGDHQILERLVNRARRS